MLSAFSVEHCPPSRWNTVRHQRGIVSAIAWNTHVRRAGGKVPALIKQIGAVLKARHYTEILDDIALLDNVHEGVQNFV